MFTVFETDQTQRDPTENIFIILHQLQTLVKVPLRKITSLPTHEKHIFNLTVSLHVILTYNNTIIRKL